jgi:hypothetical protein
MRKRSSRPGPDDGDPDGMARQRSSASGSLDEKVYVAENPRVCLRLFRGAPGQPVVLEAVCYWRDDDVGYAGGLAARLGGVPVVREPAAD